VTFDRVERPETLNAPEMLAVPAENVLITPFDENRWTELSVFRTLTFERVEIPDTENAPETLAVSAESVFMIPLEENR